MRKSTRHKNADKKENSIRNKINTNIRKDNDDRGKKNIDTDDFAELLNTMSQQEQDIED